MMRSLSGILLLGLLMLAPRVHAQDDREKAFVARANQLFDLLEAKNYEQCSTIFDSSLITVLTPQKLKTVWEPERLKMGKLLERKGVLFEDKKSYLLVYLGMKFEHDEIDFKVAFNPQMKILGFFKSPPVTKGKSSYTLPTYARPDQTIERQITVVTDSFRLPGILLMPKGVTKPPVVVMVAGSGPSDRDESVGQNKPFRDIAYGLAAAGIATLRYDKRTAVYGAHAANPPQALTPDEEVVADALSAISVARANADLDPKKIFVLGHSLGAMMAPRIAERDKNISGLIMLAAPARPFQDVILEQMEFLMPQQASKERAEQEIANDRAMTQRITDHTYTDSTSPTMLYGVPPAYWNYLQHYDQVKTALSIPQPILYLQGGMDYQVSMKDFSVWQRQLGGKANAELKLFSTYYHLFMPGKGTYTDYDVAGNVGENVISTIASWIKRQ